MILIIGDSNYRNTIIPNGDRLSAAIGEEVKFSMITNNESLKVELDGRTDSPKIIVIGAPLNEIAFKVSKNASRGRDATVKAVVEEQNKIITKSAGEKVACLHLLCPPFLRQEPKWLEEKIKLCLFYQKEFIDTNSPWNVAIGNPVLIETGDLKEDKLHLTDAGVEKLYQMLESDILKCKENLGEGQETLDWSTQVSNNPEETCPTPATLKKRPRDESNEVEQMSDTESLSEEEENSGKRAKLSFKTTVINKLTGIDTIVQLLWNERQESKNAVKAINEKIDLNTTAIDEVVGKVSHLEEAFNKEDQLTAEIREDIDSLENENLKSTVIIRKLKAVDPVPSDKKLLRTSIHTIGKGLLVKILGEDAAKDFKYAAPLYTFQDPKKKENKEGLVPPFKIGFNKKDTAIKLRDEMVKRAKDENSEYSGTYFTFFQSAGTRVRLMLMWAVVDAIKSETSEVWINQNSSKPTLQVNIKNNKINTNKLN